MKIFEKYGVKVLDVVIEYINIISVLGIVVNDS